jgi:hypothetical protein
LAGDAFTQGSAAGWPCTRHTKPGCRVAYVMVTPTDATTSAALFPPPSAAHAVIVLPPSSRKSTTTLTPPAEVHVAAFADGRTDAGPTSGSPPATRPAARIANRAAARRGDRDIVVTPA